MKRFSRRGDARDERQPGRAVWFFMQAGARIGFRNKASAPCMKRILVPCEPHDGLESMLRTACRLGAGFESMIEGFPLRPAITPDFSVDVATPDVYEMRAEADREAVRRSQDTFESVLAANYPAASYRWIADVQTGEGNLSSRARVFDITVVARPGSGRHSPRMATLEAALFDSGRPILLAPPTPLPTLGETVLIAWNRSSETARTVALSLPILKRARSVITVPVEGSVQGPAAEDLADYLAHHGISTEIVGSERAGMANGEFIASEAQRLGADLVLKGAYTQSRLRQMIFGGATRYLITESTIPVLLAS
jgi:nucleotide-binding universal stress UspA family protein